MRIAALFCLFLASLTGQSLRPADVNALPSKPADARISYGSGELQFGELRLPKGPGPFPVAVVIHGGCWVSSFATLQNTAALADALRDAGIATWNIEYRRLDNPGGGWPGTFQDVGAATDHVRTLAKTYPLDLARVATVGHSAGAHLALWASARGRLAKESAVYAPSPLPLRAAIALGGPGDLRHFYGYADKVCGTNVIDKLMGGSPDTVADRYAQGSPAELLPLGVRQVLIVGVGDRVMPAEARNSYAAAARKAGDAAEVVEVPGGHFEVIAPTSSAWATVQPAIVEVLKSAQDDSVTIEVDVRDSIGVMTPMWAWFGYDEPNYTYMKDGTKLLSELAELSPAPVYVRAHNLLTTGDGTPGLKWGSTNAYTEDANGRPIYNWTIVDRIMDTYIQRKMKPLVEIGFMPEALSTKPQPYKHDWAPGLDYGRIYTGWTYPPKDYAKWGELVHQWVKHSVGRYGKKEVESWYWEVWNEPDIGYWRGTPEEFRKLHDYAADGLKRALPTARIGGPHVTGPNGQRTQQLLRDFIEHSLRGTNHATGKTGSPLDFVAFHAKGAPRVVDGHVRMGISNQLRAIDNGFKIVASFPEAKNIPIIIGESDPEGCAACSVKTNPENAYRNGTMYSSYTAAQIARTYELADFHKVNLLGSVTWAFEFEGQPYFAGFRDLATNGVDKPVLNVFRMLGKMSGQRVRVRSSSAAAVEEIRDRGVRGRPDIYALAARGAPDVSILVWNYHDDDLPAPDAQVRLTIEGLKDGNSTVTHYRVDGEHSNSYATWLKMGSPQSPSADQYKELERSGKLATLGPGKRVRIAGEKLTETFTLPRQGVSLIVITQR